MSGRLQFYWYETKPGEEARSAWGQLVGAAHRLRFVCDELEACTSDFNLERLLRRLEYHMENYLVRVYELRERAVSLAAAISGRSEIAGLLKSKRNRGAALQIIQQMGGAFAGALETLLLSLDADIALRNQHTHDKFLSVGICTDNDIFDPADALLDSSERPEAHQRLCDFLREEIGRLVDEHVAKGNEVFDATWAFLHAAREERANPRPTDSDSG
jgi:hypothetical protein